MPNIRLFKNFFMPPLNEHLDHFKYFLMNRLQRISIQIDQERLKTSIILTQISSLFSFNESFFQKSGDKLSNIERTCNIWFQLQFSRDQFLRFQLNKRSISEYFFFYRDLQKL